MKKLLLLIGIALGFIASSRAGREPYERIEAKVREIWKRPNVKQVAGRASEKAGEISQKVAEAATDKVADVADQVGDKVTSSKIKTGRKGRPADRFSDSSKEDQIDAELAATFPSSDPSSSWAGSDE